MCFCLARIIVIGTRVNLKCLVILVCAKTTELVYLSLQRFANIMLLLKQHQGVYQTTNEQHLFHNYYFVAGYCGPTCLTSTCTKCSKTGEMTLNLSTGDVMGNLTGAIVESVAVTTNSDGAGVDCNYKARVKVSLCSNRKTLMPSTNVYQKSKVL